MLPYSPTFRSADPSLLIALPRHTWRSQTIGLEWARPGTGIFHFTLVPFGTFHVTGAAGPSTVPEAAGPRKPGQLFADSAAPQNATRPAISAEMLRDMRASWGQTRVRPGSDLCQSWVRRAPGSEPCEAVGERQPRWIGAAHEIRPGGAGTQPGPPLAHAWHRSDPSLTPV